LTFGEQAVTKDSLLTGPAVIKRFYCNSKDEANVLINKLKQA